MNVKLIAITYCLETEDSEALIEHAGRVCYRSAPRDAGRFIRQRMAGGHESILEHASASFEISGISRACSHQLVRHRLASYSQESQRYVDMSHPEWVVPPDIANNPEALAIWDRTLEVIECSYQALRERGIKKEDARFLLPNAAATRLVMTANYREWLHIFEQRISPQAQWEIREVCERVRDILREHAPSVFNTPTA